MSRRFNIGDKVKCIYIGVGDRHLKQAIVKGHIDGFSGDHWIEIEWLDGWHDNKIWTSERYFELDKPCQNVTSKIDFIEDLLK